MIRVFIVIAVVSLSLLAKAQSGFVVVEDGQFVLHEQPYRFIGANLWYGMNLGAEPEGRERLLRELDRLKELGVNNLRVLASSEGKDPYSIQPALQPDQGIYNQQIWEGLDFLLAEMAGREMKAVMVLNNFWMWSGGFPQYVKWATGHEVPFPDMEGGSWDEFINFSLTFYKKGKAQRYFRQHLKVLINRTNSISGVAYKDDPTIMSWQLANEPRGYSTPKRHRKWLAKTAKFIKKLDENHLLSAGTEGNTNTTYSGVDLIKDNQSPYIDYATTHVWIQNWGWFDPLKPETFESALQKAKDYLDSQVNMATEIGKPLVIEEFGVSRDGGSFDSDAEVTYRDRFYGMVFEYTSNQIVSDGIVQGCNFWSWGGEGRPSTPGGFWTSGSDLIGDPPHEMQGWYSVYDSDTSTVEIIRKYAK